MSDISQEELDEIEVKLSGYAKDVLDQWNRRMYKSNRDKLAGQILSREVLRIRMDPDPDNFAVNVSNTNNSEEGSTAAQRQIRKLVQNILQTLPTYHEEKFDVTELIPALVSWIGYIMDAAEDVALDVLYLGWLKQHVKPADSPSCNIMFALWCLL